MGITTSTNQGISAAGNSLETFKFRGPDLQCFTVYPHMYRNVWPLTHFPQLFDIRYNLNQYSSTTYTWVVCFLKLPCQTQLVMLVMFYCCHVKSYIKIEK